MNVPVLWFSRSYDNRSMELRPFERRYCEGYRRLDQSRDRDRIRERDPHGAAETYYPRDFSPNMYDYRRGRERERERDESYRRKGSRRKHKRRRRRTRSYSPSSSVSTATPENAFNSPHPSSLIFLFRSALSVCLSLTISSTQLLALVSSKSLWFAFVLSEFYFIFLFKWVLVNWAFVFGRAFSFFSKNSFCSFLMINLWFLLFRYRPTTVFFLGASS